MKRGLLLFCCLMMALVGCRQGVADSIAPGANVENDESAYTFISAEQKQLWREDLLALLEEIEIYDIENAIPGTFAVGLMDLDCDGIPEVIAAYTGGSMGNVYLEIWDLKTGTELASFNVGHNQNGRDVCMYVADCGGDYAVITLGTLRDHDIGWLDLVGVIDRTYHLEFPLAHTNDREAVYYYMGELTDQAQYEALYTQFHQDHVEISSTRLQLVEWDTFDEPEREVLLQKMADALLNSSQQFLDFSNE